MRAHLRAAKIAPCYNSFMADAPLAFPASLAFSVISAKHEDWCGDYLARLRAFYKGGKALLQNRGLLEAIFPRHRDEKPAIYAERCKRAFYLPYAGEILNFICASLSAERLEVGLKKPDGATDAPETPEWYGGFFDDVSPPGGRTTSMHDFVKLAVLEGLICKTAWARVDLPKPDEFVSLAEQDAAGARNAYAVMMPAECVIDWEEDNSGELEFVITQTQENKRKTLIDGRDLLTERFTVYTATSWAIYELTHKRNEAPTDVTPVPLMSHGDHSFGRVQWCRLDVGDGLWAMDNVESACREHFNKRSALGWAELQSLLPELYEYLGPEDPATGTVIGEGQQDANRGTSQARGQGYVQIRGADDKAAFVGPDSGPFAEARQSCDDLRTEIHRVTHQMALAVDNSAAALRRSADSKGQDKASAVVVFEALGQIARKFAEDVTDMASRGRGETDYAGEWQATGMAKFDAISVGAAVDQATQLELIKIPSPTFQRLYKAGLAKEVLGDEASQEDLDAIEDELAKNITSEQLTRPEVNPFEMPPKATDTEEEAAGETLPEKQPGTARKGEENLT